MAHQGAKLQSCNNELVKCLDELCERRTRLEREIDREQQEKRTLEAQMQTLRCKLDSVSQSLDGKLATKAEFDKTIADTEHAYMKILESSQVLLNVVKKESVALAHKNASAEKSSSHFQ